MLSIRSPGRPEKKKDGATKIINVVDLDIPTNHMANARVIQPIEPNAMMPWFDKGNSIASNQGGNRGMAKGLWSYLSSLRKRDSPTRH